MYYFSENKNNILFEKEILNKDDKIQFVFDYNNLVINNSVYTIEFAGVVKEPSYLEFNNYPIFIENYGDKDQESFYSPRILIGKTCFYNFTIKNSLSGENTNSCAENCKVCYKGICIKCIDNYILIEDSNICTNNIQNDNFYIDAKNNLLRKCHESCLSCSDGPIYSINSLNIENTNCDICIENYYKIINTNNCIHKDNAPIGYYLDIDKGLFLNCYEKCLTCSNYKLNLTSLNCLSCDENSIFYEYSHNCLDCVLREKYVNYFQYDCIDSIPDGYYLLNEDDKTIDLCYFTCKHCNEKGNSENHKCTECSDAYPYNFNNGQNCLDDCSKESLFLDEIDKKCYENCKDNVNDRKYNYKNKCISLANQPKNYQLDNYNFLSLCEVQAKYEFNNECYDNCPEGTILDESLPNKKICTCNNLYYLKGEKKVCISSNVCPEEYPYLRIGSSECTNCPVKYKDKCYDFCPKDTCITQINSNFETCVDQMELTEILGGICFDDFPLILEYIDNINNSSDQIISINSSPGVTLSIYENGLDLEENNNFYNLTIINLDNCQAKLMEYYQLNSNDTLYILSLDSISKMSNQIFNDIDFKIYLNKGKELDKLYACYDTPISVSTPIINEDIINYGYAVYFHEQGYDIYNLNSSFYNDLCTSISLNNSDMILKDRLEYIFPSNLTSFCPDNCIINETDIKNKRINCICDIYFSAKNKAKSDELNILGLKINKQKLLDSLSLKTLNFGILKCFKVLTKDNLIHNIGNYVLLFLILIYIIGIIIFYTKGYKVLVKKIQEIVDNKHEELKTVNLKEINIEVYSNKSNPTKKSKKINFGKLVNKNNLNKNEISLEKNKSSKSNININTKDKIKKFRKKNKKEKKMENKFDYNDYELNSFSYKMALQYDKRTYFQYYISLLKRKHLIIFSFFPANDYNSIIIKIIIFFFSFSFVFFVNALFYNDASMHKIYQAKGEYDFIYQIPTILYSTLISGIIIFIIKYLSLTEKNILQIKNEKIDENIFIISQNILRKIKIKLVIFFILSFIFLSFFWYYLSCFCAIYKKSQIHLFKDTIISFSLSLLYPFLLNLLPGIFRIPSLRDKNKNKEYLYKFSKVVQII